MGSLGVVLYEALAGAPLFRGASLNEVCTALILQPAAPLAEVRPEVPPAIAAVVEGCLSKERRLRPPDAGVLARAMAEAAAAHEKAGGAHLPPERRRPCEPSFLYVIRRRSRP